MNHFYYNYVPEEEWKKVDEIEPFDEFEVSAMLVYNVSRKFLIVITKEFHQKNVSVVASVN